MDEAHNPSDFLTRQFYDWELRGRGWTVWPGPVGLEPPFRPFTGHVIPRQSVSDDGQFETGLSRLGSSLLSGLFGIKEAKTEPPPVEETEDPVPEFTGGRSDLVELQTFLPADLDISRESFGQFLLSLHLCREPVTFELLGTATQITVQFTVHEKDAPLVRQQLQAFFPDAVFLPKESVLESAWMESESAIVEFGLGKEFMLPLASGKLDPFVGITGALAELGEGELGLFQVMFQPVRHPWAESVIRAVTDNGGEPFFVNAPELQREAERKVAAPLYAAVVRIATQSPAFDRAWEIARDLAGSLRVFAAPAGNELIPLKNDEYPFADHVEDVLRRQCRRSGMLLNSEELTGFVHLPSEAVRSRKLARMIKRTKAPPQVATGEGLLLGTNLHEGQATAVTLTPEQRVRHTHLIGASGTGKSTLLFNLICQDIQNGQGLAVLDPHGDLVDRVLGVVPEERIPDVVLVDPADEEYSIGFNILSAHSELEKNLLASDLVSVFQRLSTSWGDQMASVLTNAILAFLESSRGGTVADLRRFLLEPAFREEFLATVRDPDVVYYWRKGFTQLAGNKSIGPVLTRLETFLSRKPIRYMVSQKVNRLDFANILDTGKIFLAKLSQGTLGRENSYLLGTLLVAKFQQLAMSRQSQAVAARRDFWLYIDEFHNFITPSMAEILSGARKYRIGLVLAHQELRQLQRDPEVASAVLSNAYTRVCFRVGDDDARKLGEGFAFFETRDLQSLSTGKAIARVERSDFDFNLSVALPPEPDAAQAEETRRAVIEASRRKYGTPRTQVEATLYEGAGSITAAKSEPAGLKKRRDALGEALEQDQLPPPAAERKPAEVQPQPARATPTTREAKAPPPPPADLGRGGAQHQIIQKRLKGVAEDLGFRATIEKRILAGQGSVDLFLERPPHTIACEISITTTIDHEVGNVAKCLKAGVASVAVICVAGERLNQIRKAVEGSLGQAEASRVGYYTPDEFIAHLQNTALAQPSASGPPERKCGYIVKRIVLRLTPDETKAREEVALKMIAETMRRRR